MHGMDARHARGEVLTGSAVESAGRPPAVSGREGSDMDSGMVPVELVTRWQGVYGEYVAVDRMGQMSPNYAADMARLSAEVAAAWRDLAATPGLAWWLVAALTTAAEAFDRQARAWHGSQASAGRPAEHGSGPRRLQPGERWFDSAAGDVDHGGQ
jgi:hypothetical protein